MYESGVFTGPDDLQKIPSTSLNFTEKDETWQVGGRGLVLHSMYNMKACMLCGVQPMSLHCVG